VHRGCGKSRKADLQDKGGRPQIVGRKAKAKKIRDRYV